MEQVGYATSATITGPYDKYAGNPCIPSDLQAHTMLVLLQIHGFMSLMAFITLVIRLVLRLQFSMADSPGNDN